MRRFGVTLGLLLQLVAASPANAIPAEEMAARIEQARVVARQGIHDPSPESMSGVRGALGLPDEVMLSGGSVELGADPYLERLEGTTARDFELALRRLDALERALDAPRPMASSDELREHLDAAYGTVRSPEPGLLQRVREMVDSFLSAVFRGAGRALGGGPGLLLFVLLAAGAALIFWRMRPRWQAEAVARPAGGGMSAEEWKRRSDAARARGDLGEAVSALYRSVVAELTQRGMLEDRVSLTAGEVRAATIDTLIAQPILEASRSYERVRYGRAPATQEDLDALLRAERAARSG